MSTDYARKVSDSLIDQLQRGTAPWQKPWKPGERHLPYNPTTGKDYRGLNTVWLMAQGYEDARWLTYKQAAAEGAQVRKGEKGTVIQYFKFSGQEPVTDSNGKPILDEDGKQKTITVQYERPRMFHAVVFNAQQIDGLQPAQPRELASEHERHELAERILLNSGAQIKHLPGNRAFYSPRYDQITLPLREQFHDASGYYATALHELGHWTGHPTRLDRDLSHPFGSEGYAKEELRAEIASLMLGDQLGIGHDPGQHAAYVGSWIKALQEDPREIFRAAAEAEKITAYVMGLEQERIQAVEGEITVQTLIDLREESRKAAADALGAIAMLQQDPGLDDDEIKQQQSAIAEMRDAAQARLNVARADAAPEVRDAFDRIESIEAAIMDAQGKVSFAAYNLEMARWTPEEQELHQASAGFTEAEAIEAFEKEQTQLDQATAELTQIVTEHGLTIPNRPPVKDNAATVGLLLHAAHASAEDGYSPLTTWETHKVLAEQNGLTAAIEVTGSADATDAPYLVSYTDLNGIAVPITTEIHRDGKSLTSLNGERVEGSLWTVDAESQEAALRTAVTWHVQSADLLRAEQVLDNADRARSIEAELMQLGYRMEYDLGAIPGEGHTLVDLTSGEAVDADEVPERVIALAREWSDLADHNEEHVAQQDTPPQQHPVLHKTPENAVNNRTYIAVPYAEKDAAKKAAQEAGFKLTWDKEAKAWYAPANADLSTLERWTKAETVAPVTDRDVILEFGAALKNAGFQLDGEPVMDGRIHRVPVDGDRGPDRSGAYSGHLGGYCPGGYIKNHRTGEEINWKSSQPVNTVDAATRAQLNAEAAERKQRLEVARQQGFERASQFAGYLFERSGQATAAHPYCEKKGIETPLGVRTVPDAADGVHIATSNREAKQMREQFAGQPVFVAGDLLVPARDFDDKLWSVQSVSAGFKSFMTGGRKSGLHAMAGTDAPFGQSALAKDDTMPLVIVEGYATGDTLSKALGHPVVVAFDAGNLESVAVALREKFPTREIVIAGDNDHTKEGRIGPDGKVQQNVGRIKAEEAAHLVGGVAVVPSFSPDSKGTDWNDLAQEKGLGVVSLQYTAALNAGREKQQSQAQSRSQSQQQSQPAANDEQVKRRGVSR